MRIATYVKAFVMPLLVQSAVRRWSMTTRRVLGRVAPLGLEGWVLDCHLAWPERLLFMLALHLSFEAFNRFCHLLALAFCRFPSRRVPTLLALMQFFWQQGKLTLLLVPCCAQIQYTMPKHTTIFACMLTFAVLHYLARERKSLSSGQGIRLSTRVSG